MIRLLRRAVALLALAALGACGGGSGHGGTGGPTPMFTAAANVPLTAGVSAVAMADFNLDGKPDLAVANATAGSVEIRLGTGIGTFAVGSSIPLLALASPSAIIAADFNGDGKLDLAIANAGLDTVVVYKGLGTGVFTFWSTVPLALGAGPSGLVAADFNGNGDLDLAISDFGTDSVSIALGDGLGGFGAPTTTLVGIAFASSAVAAADFNRDGNADLAVTSAATGNVAIFTGVGDGTFNAPLAVIVDALANLASIVTPDLNRDGKADLVVTNKTTGQVSVLLGNGSGGFGGVASFAAGADATAIAAGDFDRNGRLDLAVTLAASGQVAIIRGNGDGTLAAPVLFGAGGTGSAAVAVGDADIDGSLDVAVANGTTGDVGVLVGMDRTLTVGFAAGTGVLIGGGAQPKAVVWADVNRDGSLDLVTANFAGNSVSVALGTGAGAFAAATTTALSPGDGPVALALADFDGDGDLDIAVANQTSGKVRILTGSGTGLFVLGALITLPATSSVTAVVAGDFNTDGAIDVAISSNLSGTGYVSTVLGNGNGTFAAPVPFAITAGFAPVSMVASDLDHDGDLDLAIASGANGSVAIFLGNNFGGLLAGTPVPMGGVADVLVGITAGDFNNDGTVDLAATNQTGSAVWVALGIPLVLGTFSPPVNLVVGAGASAIATGDFDRDGTLDLALTLAATGQIRILIGNGDGTFGAIATLSTVGTTVVGIAVDDINRDGKLDVAVANQGGGTVEIQLGS